MSNENDSLIDRVAETLRDPVRVSSDFDDRVLSSLERPPNRIAELGRWFLEPRPMAISPLAWFASAAAILLVVGGGVWGMMRSARLSPERVALTQVPTHDSVQVVQFVFIAPTARKVSLAGDFNDWNMAATPMQRVSEGGAWSVTIPLRPGRYVYSFVVDGVTWTADPLAPPAVQDDDYGKPNSVVMVRRRGA
jgi:hypothetical protein